MTARDFLASDRPEEPPCPWTYLGAPCVLVRGHASPHWLEVEQAMLPDPEKAQELLKKAPARAADE